MCFLNSTRLESLFLNVSLSIKLIRRLSRKVVFQIAFNRSLFYDETFAARLEARVLLLFLSFRFFSVVLSFSFFLVLALNEKPEPVPETCSVGDGKHAVHVNWRRGGFFLMDTLDKSCDFIHRAMADAHVYYSGIQRM